MDKSQDEFEIKFAIVTNQRNAAMDEIASLAAKIHILESKLKDLSNNKTEQAQP